MSNKPHVVDELHAYALGIQTRQEQNRVEAHVDSCVSCRAELLAWDRLVGSLSEAYATERPPEDLERKILERFAAEAATRTSPPRNEALRKSLRFRRPRRIAVGVAVGVALVVGIGSFLILGKSRDKDQITMDLQERAMVVELHGSSPSSPSFGMVIFERHKFSGILVVGELAALSEGTQYQLWLVYEDERLDGGTFSVNERGTAIHPVHAPYPLERCRAFSVTIEGAGGKGAPTGPTVLSGIVSL